MERLMLLEPFLSLRRFETPKAFGAGVPNCFGHIDCAKKFGKGE